MFDFIINFIRSFFEIHLLKISLLTQRIPLTNNLIGNLVDFFYPRFVTNDSKLIKKLSKCPLKPYLVKYLLRSSISPITTSDCDFITMNISDQRYLKLNLDFRKKIKNLASKNLEIFLNIPKLSGKIEIHYLLTKITLEAMFKLLFELDINDFESFLKNDFSRRLQIKFN